MRYCAINAIQRLSMVTVSEIGGILSSRSILKNESISMILFMLAICWLMLVLMPYGRWKRYSRPLEFISSNIKRLESLILRYNKYYSSASNMSRTRCWNSPLVLPQKSALRVDSNSSRFQSLGRLFNFLTASFALPGSKVIQPGRR